MRLSAKNKLLDKFHHGFVYCCMGLSVVALVGLAQMGYDYYVNIKPALKAEKLKKERELLQEGSPFLSEAETTSA